METKLKRLIQFKRVLNIEYPPASPESASGSRPARLALLAWRAWWRAGRTAEQGTAEMCNDHFDILRFKYGEFSHPPQKSTRKHPGCLAGAAFDKTCRRAQVESLSRAETCPPEKEFV